MPGNLSRSSPCQMHTVFSQKEQPALPGSTQNRLSLFSKKVPNNQQQNLASPRPQRSYSPRIQSFQPFAVQHYNVCELHIQVRHFRYWTCKRTFRRHVLAPFYQAFNLTYLQCERKLLWKHVSISDRFWIDLDFML